MSWSSQIKGPSPSNTYGFKVTQVNLQNAKALHEVIDALESCISGCNCAHFSERSRECCLPSVQRSGRNSRGNTLPKKI